jgi:L-asparaginase
MSNGQLHDVVNTLPLERDERVDELQRRLGGTLIKERAYTELDSKQKNEVDGVLASLATMRFEDRVSLERVTRSLIGGIASDLEKYVPIALEAAAKSMEKARGVLVIYTGGTIGSAPRDPNDPESPQVVQPWKVLKAASPQLGLLGYPVDAIAFEEPLDSCNVGPMHWRTIARIINESHKDYEGWVILHGTDSMVYTASALSFMLVDLAKPVVITGAQLAGIASPRNDAHQNIITALMLANPVPNKLPVIPEVFISFGNLIVRGNRARKSNVIGYQGFRAPNYPTLGEVGEYISIDRKHVRKIPEGDLQLFDQLDTNVIMLEVFPGMQHSKVLENILRDQSLRGVILKSYGAGNIPTDRPFLDLFTSFIDRGGVVVNVTSVQQGEVVMGLYETSQILLDRGLIGGFDLTPEAAMAKLMVLLGTYGDDKAKVRRLMQQSIAGEQRLSLETTEFPGSGKVSAGGASGELPKQQLASVADAERIERVMLRFKRAQLDPGVEERAAIRLALDDGTPLGTYRRLKVPAGTLVKDDPVGESLSLDLTAHRDRFVSKAASGRIQALHRLGFVVEMEAKGGGSFAWDGAELNIYTTD